MDLKFRSASVRKIPKSFSLSVIKEMRKDEFIPSEVDEGYLFLEKSEYDTYIFKYLNKVTLIHTEYNGNFTKKTDYDIKETIFEIDLKNSFMIVYSGKSQSDYFMRRLFKKIGYFDSFISINFIHFLSMLKQSNYIVQSEEAVINGFTHNEILIGKYIASIKSLDILHHVLNSYTNKVVKIKLQLEDQNENVSILSIDKSGSFTFNSFDKNNEYLLKYCILNSIVGDLEWL
ncbi:hypothetical protein [Methanococcoides sp. NM1]|uniref:hypothetical protein n=1 Tax=Methanococcoides sp. NM1 TaxID=1201013 RepID=UPI001082FB08|nr:hypothetical protein [Methanococcoides sp. NM1]